MGFFLDCKKGAVVLLITGLMGRYRLVVVATRSGAFAAASLEFFVLGLLERCRFSVVTADFNGMALIRGIGFRSFFGLLADSSSTLQ